MEQSSSRERIRDVAGWTFEQFALAAAFMQRRSPLGFPAPTLEGLFTVQRFWREHVAAPDPHKPLRLYAGGAYQWAWTCAAFADAEDFCRRMGLLRDVPPRPEPTT